MSGRSALGYALHSFLRREGTVAHVVTQPVTHVMSVDSEQLVPARNIAERNEGTENQGYSDTGALLKTNSSP